MVSSTLVPSWTDLIGSNHQTMLRVAGSGICHQTQRHVSHCRQCQLCKGNPKNCGHLPTKEAEPSVHGDRVNVDLAGPFSVKTPKGVRQILLPTLQPLIQPLISLK